MPYVKLTPQERAESRRKAMEKSLATRRASAESRGKITYIRIPKKVVDHLNAVAVACGVTQIDAITRAVMAVEIPAANTQEGGSPC